MNLLFTLTSIAFCAIWSCSAQSSERPTPVTESNFPPTRGPPVDQSPYNCVPHNCTTVFSPICSTANERLVVDNNRCYHNQRVRCDKQRFPKNPSVKYLHDGYCRGTECEGMIPRIYKPQCSSVNGEPETDDNAWAFRLKRDCARNFRQDFNTNSPIVRFLHDGECFGNEDVCWRNCRNTTGPVCVTIGGYLETKSSRCEINNLKRCGNTGQNVTYLHDGKCRGNELDCQNRCANVRRPVCGAVNGNLVTEKNLCTLRAKIRCEKRLRRLGRRLPVRRLRYRGACRTGGTRRNSKASNYVG